MIAFQILVTFATIWVIIGIICSIKWRNKPTGWTIYHGRK